MDGWMYGQTDGWSEGWVDGRRMDGWTSLLPRLISTFLSPLYFPETRLNKLNHMMIIECSRFSLWGCVLLPPAYTDHFPFTCTFTFLYHFSAPPGQNSSEGWACCWVNFQSFLMLAKHIALSRCSIHFNFLKILFYIFNVLCLRNVCYLEER